MSGRLHSLMESELIAAFDPVYIDCGNFSDQHRLAPGSESHFQVTLVSEKFNGLSRVQRHKLVYQVIKRHFEAQLHAAVLNLYTPEEWAKSPRSNPPPLCGG